MVPELDNTPVEAEDFLKGCSALFRDIILWKKMLDMVMVPFSFWYAKIGTNKAGKVVSGAKWRVAFQVNPTPL